MCILFCTLFIRPATTFIPVFAVAGLLDIAAPTHVIPVGVVRDTLNLVPVNVVEPAVK